MCGIIGVVGVPLSKELSYILTTHLLLETQRRGPHATGHFMVDAEESQIFHFKSPLPAKHYVNLHEWRILEETSVKALIGHDRYKTKGNEYANGNNHPHVSKKGNLGLVHNGTIHKFDEHKKEYNCQDSDSEMLLKILVKEGNIIRGIKKIFELFGSSGDFACEAIFRDPETGKTRFFFWRETGRPGRFIDATKETGQYFFCSTTEIWNDAIKAACKQDKRIANLGLDKLKVEKIDPFEIWEVDCQTKEIVIHSLPKPKARKRKKKKPGAQGIVLDYSSDTVKPVDGGTSVTKYTSYKPTVKPDRSPVDDFRSDSENGNGTHVVPVTSCAREDYRHTGEHFCGAGSPGWRTNGTRGSRGSISDVSLVRNPF